jgi:hypothetical protein
MDSYVLKFSRAKDVYDQLLTDRIWANTPAQAEIRTMLSSSGMSGAIGMSFDATATTQEPVDTPRKCP